VLVSHASHSKFLIILSKFIMRILEWVLTFLILDETRKEKSHVLQYVVWMILNFKYYYEYNFYIPFV
jgi:hypothetical protein